MKPLNTSSTLFELPLEWLQHVHGGSSTDDASLPPPLPRRDDRSENGPDSVP